MNVAFIKFKRIIKMFSQRVRIEAYFGKARESVTGLFSSVLPSVEV